MTVLVATANFGGRDVPHVAASQENVECEWRYYTDGPEIAPAPWTTTQVAGRIERSPNMAAKQYKVRPPDRGWEAMVWVDASMQITCPTFVSEAVGVLHASGAPVAAHAHPRRDCLYDEAEASLGPEGLGRYDGLPIAAQMAAYREEGHPAHDGLWACGVLVWACDGRSRALGDAWWAECLRWGYQDQLSFPVVCRRLGYRPATFPVPLIERTDRRGGLANRWLRINPHLPGTGG